MIVTKRLLGNSCNANTATVQLEVDRRSHLASRSNAFYALAGHIEAMTPNRQFRLWPAQDLSPSKEGGSS